MSAIGIEERLARLERSAKRWRIAAAMLGLALAGVLGMGAAQDAIPKQIRAEKLVANQIDLVSDAGATVGWIGVSKKGEPGLVFRGKNDKIQVNLGLVDGDARLSLTDSEQKSSLRASAGISEVARNAPDAGKPGTPKGVAALELRDGDGRERVNMVADSTKSTTIRPTVDGQAKDMP